jgi:hypothetical protein
MKPNHLIARPVVDCIADGREPSVHELFEVAERIWTDTRTARSAFSWSDLPVDGSERLISLRAAQAALTGNE